jgi:nucleotide-binding universal stress UspA family protein
MPFQRIVVGVDFSSGSLNAVRWLAGTFAPGARIFVVHVIAQPSVPPFLRSHLAADLSEQEATLYPGLRAFAGFAGGDPADAIVAAGNPSVELARLATVLGADLICVGRSRRRSGSGRFGATTPQRLLAHTSIPMLIVPESACVVPGAVLAAVSDGRDATETLEVGAALAECWNVRLVALHALEPEVVAFARGMSRGSSETADARLCELANEWLAAFVAAHASSERRQAITRVGDAGEEVIAHAARTGAGMIVAGRRVRHHVNDVASGVAGVGSTTRLITWATSCPVLVLGSGAPDTHRSPPRRTQRGVGAHLINGAHRSSTSFRPSLVRPPNGDDAA